MRYRHTLIKVLITVILILAAVTTVYHYQRYQEIYQDNLASITKRALNYLAIAQREYLRAFSGFRSMLDLLANGQDLQDYLDQPTALYSKPLEKNWQAFIDADPLFLNLVFVNLQGQYQVSIQTEDARLSTSMSPRTSTQPSGLLRYAQSLPDDEIGLWDNRSRLGHASANMGTLQVKLIRPVLRQGRRMGYLVLSVDPNVLSARVNDWPDLLLHPNILDAVGYYVVNPLPVADAPPTSSPATWMQWSQSFPKTWLKMQQYADGFFLEKDTLTVFKTMKLSNSHPLYLTISLARPDLLSFAENDIDALNRETWFALLLSLTVFIPTIFMLMYYRRTSIDSQLARAALSGMSAVMILDRYCKTVLVNPEFTRLTGLSSHQVESKNALKNLLGQSHVRLLRSMFSEVKKARIWEDEVILYQGEREITTIMRVQSSLDSKGRLSYYIVSFVDISERKVLEEKLRILSEKDTMSDLWNRRKFEQELRRAALVSKIHESMKPTCLALIDIDHFKRINDQRGHDEGDRIISRVSQVMASQVRHSDFLARIGGEEFAVIMPNTTIADANLALSRVREEVENDRLAGVTVSIGFTQLTSDYTRSYKCADIALYESKTIGRNQVSVCLDCEDIA